MTSVLRRFGIALALLGFACILPATTGAQPPPVYITQWGSQGPGNGQFNFPASIARDAAGNVYVLDNGNNRVQKFSAAGAYITQWGTAGSGNGEFSSPWGVATDASGNVYVADNGNYRIQKFTSSGVYLTQWGSPGTGDGQFNTPVGVATDAAGNVYVAEAYNYRISKFTGTGTFITKWGSLGSGNGQFNVPFDVATDAAGNVYVADENNHRVQKFTSTGTYISQWGSYGTGNGEFRSPWGVATDPGGNVYVAEFDNHRVQKFTDAGTYLTQWGSSGSGNGQFSMPRGLAIDAAGHVFVVDSGNNRIQKFGPPLIDDIAADPTGLCISTPTPCVAVPVRWRNRSNATPVRAYSVTIELSSNLSLCGPQITSGGYLRTGSGGAPIFVTPLGGNRYTVDQSTLGSPCGATGNGTLFYLHLSSSDLESSGSITVTAVKARDCSNNPVPATVGDVATIGIDHVAPAGLLDLDATQSRTGNYGVPISTTNIRLTWSGQESGSSVEVYRKGFGGYPQYDENGGAVPATPATPAAAITDGWTLSSVTNSGEFDRTAARDYYYFVAFVLDGCNTSAVSNMTGGTLNYHLGDVHNGSADCAGDDQVRTEDVSFLGGNYGDIPLSDPVECLDVGPTTDYSVNGRPTTDNVTDFEDLILFGINYNAVSAPQMRALPAAAAANALMLRVPVVPEVGQTFAVGLELAGAGDIQGLSAALDYDPAVVEFLGVEPGGLLAAQAQQGVVLSARPGVVDVVMLGVGQGMTGQGEIAQARFRVRADGPSGIALASVKARDAENRDVALGQTPSPGGPKPTRTALAAARPTPFRDRTMLECALVRGGEIRLGIYGVDGRRIRTLADGTRAAGVYRFDWDGRDDAGREVAAGMYFARLVTNDGKLTRTLVRIP